MGFEQLVDPALTGLFVTALWSLRDTLIYKIPQLRRDDKQAKFVQEALEKIAEEVQAVQNRLNNESLRYIGEEFIKSFRGDIEKLNLAVSYFNDNRSEIMGSLGRIENGQQRILDGVMEILDRLPDKDILPASDRGGFVSQVAEVFRITKHEIKLNIVVGGEKVDISASLPMTLGRPKQITYVQCVHDHEVTRKEMNDFRKTLSEVPRDTGMMVSQYGFEVGALELAEENRIVALTYDELVSQIIDFSSYLNKCIEDYENQGVEQGVPLKKLYVEQDVIEDRTRKEYHLGDYAAGWLKDDSQNLLVILGDFGIGKTSYTLKLASELAERRKQTNAGIIPVRIELKSYRETLEYEAMIVKQLTNFGVPTTGYEAFDFLLKKGEILLILDAFDEMEIQVNEKTTRKNFGELCKAFKGKAKVILTCRTHYFREHPEVESLIYDFEAPKGFRTQEGTALYREIFGRRNCKICFLKPFDDKKIGQYLQKAMPEERKAAVEMLKKDKGLKDLATRPVLLAMIAQSFQEITKMDKIPSTAALYEVYIQKWVERDDARMNLTKEGKQTFAEELAARLWTEKRDRIHHSELREMVEAYFKSSIRVPVYAEYAEHEVMTASFLTRDAAGNYGFAHKSFMEFFLARKFAGEIESNQIVDFGKERITQEVIDFLKGLITDESLLYEVIRNKTPEEVGYAGANFVSVLIAMKDDRLGIGANLSYFTMIPTKDDLVGADFSNCVLSHAEFGHYSLVNADFSFAYMEDISLTLCNFKSIALSPDGKYIIVGGVAIVGGLWDGYPLAISSDIIILDSSDFSIVKEMKTKDYICHIAYSPDGEYIALGSFSGHVNILSSSDFSVVMEVGKLYYMCHVIYSPDERYIIFAGGNRAFIEPGHDASVSGSGGLIILSSSDFSVVEKIKTEYYIRHITYSPDGRYIIAGGGIGNYIDGSIGGGITILSSSDFSVVKEIETQYDIHHFTYSPDEKYIIIGGGIGNRSGGSNIGGVTILSSSDFSVVKEIETQYYVSHITYSPDAKYIVFGGGADGGTMTILSSSDFSIIKEIKTQYYVSHIIYSPDAKYIVLAGSDIHRYKYGRIAILDAESFEVVKEIVSVVNDVRGMKIDGVKGLDPVLEEALKRAINYE